jgi:hypothetical protein
VVSQKTMKTLRTQKDLETEAVEQNSAVVQKIHEEFINFRRTMEELRLLKRVAADLRSYKKMIKLKRYD